MKNYRINAAKKVKGVTLQNRIILLIISFVFSCTIVFGQENMQNYIGLKHSLGSSLFLLGNIIPEDAIYAFQLDYSYQWTQKDVVIIEGIT